MSDISEVTQQLLDAIEEGQYALKEAGYTEGLADGKKLSSGVSWDNFQDKGNRKDYDGAFRYWSVEEISPKYIVAPTGYCSQLFYGCSNLKIIDKSKFDLSKADYEDDMVTVGYNLCGNCKKLEVFPDIGVQAGGYMATWLNCPELHTIEMWRVNENINISSSTFRGCRKLQNILDIEGLFGTNVNFAQCSSLSPATMKRIIKHLKIYKQTEHEYEHTVTFNSTAFDVLEAEGISEEDWEWLAEQFPNADIELVKEMVDNSWEMLIGLCLGWNLVA